MAEALSSSFSDECPQQTLKFSPLLLYLSTRLALYFSRNVPRFNVFTSDLRSIVMVYVLITQFSIQSF